MFRHSTKQNVRSQEWLRQRAIRSLNSGRQVLCDSVYTNTYGVELPGPSVDILSNIVVPLTGCNSTPDRDTRRVFTVTALEYPGTLRLRMCFIQPEVSSATAHTSSAFSTVLSRAREELLKEMNNPSPGGISASAEKCQVAGRLAPYVVERAGLSSSVSWSYCNASKSRFFYIVTSPGSAELMGLTRETLGMYQSFGVQDCAMVYSSSTRCFKVTVSPGPEDEGEDPNKSTCMFLYCDGTFKVLGTPHKAYKVCKLFRDTVLRAHASPMHSRIVDTLVPLKDPGA